MTTEELRGNMTSYSLTMVTEVCINCGIPFAIPKNYQDRLKEAKTTFYCPNGHRQYYCGQTEAEKLKIQLQRKENELAQKITANFQLDNQLTKIKKDIALGKCPCCGKTYKHLANHMARKHPKGR